MPRVSVIIPAFQARSTIQKAIKSVIVQTEQDFEIIVVDDCSTDMTSELISEMREKDARISYHVLDTNQGRSVALNTAINYSKGKWIAVLDADDWYHPERLASLITLAENMQVTMVADNQIFIDEDIASEVGTAFKNKGRVRKFTLNEYMKGSNPRRLFDYGMLKPIILADFIHRSKIEYFKEARNGQDFYYLFSFFAAGGTAAITDTPYYFYAQPFGSTSKKGRNRSNPYYNFELMRFVNEKFIERYQETVSEENLDRLRTRGKDFSALISFHKIRDNLRKQQWGELTLSLVSASPRFWGLFLSRLKGRITKSFIARKSFMDD